MSICRCEAGHRTEAISTAGIASLNQRFAMTDVIFFWILDFLSAEAGRQALAKVDGFWIGDYETNGPS